MKEPLETNEPTQSANLLPGFISIQKQLPRNDCRVFVACANYQTVGYLDRNQVWRHNSNDTELANVIGWQEVLL
jgi:hypothetical protein